MMDVVLMDKGFEMGSMGCGMLNLIKSKFKIQTSKKILTPKLKILALINKFMFDLFLIGILYLGFSWDFAF